VKLAGLFTGIFIINKRGIYYLKYKYNLLTLTEKISSLRPTKLQKYLKTPLLAS